MADEVRVGGVSSQGVQEECAYDTWEYILKGTVPDFK